MKRYVLLVFGLLFFLGSAFGTPKIKWNQAYQSYFIKYKDIAIREMLRYGIPASITLAQGVLESGAGRSRLATEANNHFGIKCHDWTGRTVSHNDDLDGECFRAYNSALESYEDHSKFLTGRQRYNSLFLLPRTDYRAWAYGLKRAGYATNPNYANSLISIIELYQLYRYDNATSYNAFPDNVFIAGKDSEKPSPGASRQPPTAGNASTMHSLRAYNSNCYLVVRRGDTFKSIGRETGISGRKLARYNERKYKDTLREGEIVWLGKKRKRAPKEFKKRQHIVGNSESLYDIAQKYGIRLKSLVKKNRQLAEDGVRVGDKVRIY